MALAYSLVITGRMSRGGGGGVALLLRLLLVLALVAVSVAAAHRRRVSWLRYSGFRAPPVGGWAPGVLWGLAFALVALLSEQLLGVRLLNLAPPAAGGGALVAALAYAAVWRPLAEEWLTRGFLLPLARERWPNWAAVLLQALVFAALHWRAGLGWPHVGAALVFGLGQGVLVLRTESLWVALVSHALVNATGLLWYGST